MANATPSLWGRRVTTAQAAPAGFSAGQTGSLGDDTKYKPLFNYDASQVDYSWRNVKAIGSRGGLGPSESL